MKRGTTIHAACAHRRRTTSGARTLSALALSAASALTLGCSSMRLVPVSGGSGGDVVARAPGGLEVLAHDGSTAHPWTVPVTYTPVRISVSNLGPEPIYVALDDIRLTGATRALEAVPPQNIPPRRRVTSLGMDPGSPFVALQSLSASGPRIGRTESIVLEPAYNSRMDARRFETAAARGEIADSAFPGGTIDSGETREGFVYFREVPPEPARWVLRIGVRNDARGEPTRVVEIGYTTKQG